MNKKRLNLATVERNGIVEIDHKFKHLCAEENSSILKALEIIELGTDRICFVIDKNNKLIRVISDGDIRRALLKGYLPTDLVVNIHSRQPIVAKHNYPEQALEYLSKWVRIAPIVDENNEITGVLRLKEFPVVDTYDTKQLELLVLATSA